MTSRQQDDANDIPFPDKVTEVQRAFFELAFRTLHLGHTPTAEEIESAMLLIDSGSLDEMIESSAKPVQRTSAPEHYGDLKPFCHEEWMARHGTKRLKAK